VGVKQRICALVALLLTTSFATGITTDANAKRKKPESTKQITETLIGDYTPEQLCDISEKYVVYENKLYVIGRYSHEGKLERDEADRIDSHARRNAWEIVDYLANEASLGTSQIRQDLSGTNRTLFTNYGVSGPSKTPTYSACVVLEIDPTRNEHNETAQKLVTMALDLSD
jgi:hypothetical protein